MFENNHTGHKFEHLKQVYQKHVDLVKAEANIVRKVITSLFLLIFQASKGTYQPNESSGNQY